MDFHKEEHGAVLVEVVDITRATMKEAEEFKQILVKDIELGWRKIVIDLTDCEYIDSTFLGTFVVSLKRIASLGGDIRLVIFHYDVNSMIQLTRLYKVFKTFRNKNDAIKSFKEEPGLKDNYEYNDSLFSNDNIIPLEKIKEESIKHALKITKGDIDEAAKKLEISKASICELMEKYNIDNISKK
jgi:anti-anti-sigma factor